MILQVVMDSSVQKGSLKMVGPEMFAIGVAIIGAAAFSAE